ncbi:hypothetical protein [Streptomyces lavendulae]|uniref:hypothetical protein n=1 Tax=Streptomyces lavendulae TaxID=1914 RepID=UPI0036E38B16
MPAGHDDEGAGVRERLTGDLPGRLGQEQGLGGDEVGVAVDGVQPRPSSVTTSAYSAGTRIRFAYAARPTSWSPATSTSLSVRIRTLVGPSRAYAKTSPSATTRA